MPAVSNFAFLRAEWPAVHEAAIKAEAATKADPRSACFYARRALELAVAWMFKSDPSLRLPYQDNLSALIHEPSFKLAVGDAVFAKARMVNQLGNQAVHSHRRIHQLDALTAVRELFHVSYWLAHTYARGARPAPGLAFDADALGTAVPLPNQTLDQLQKLELTLRERDEKLSALLGDKQALDEELKRLRAEVAEAKKASAGQPDTHDYSEAETRDFFIDLLLKEAGWPLDQERDREFEVSGMPNTKGTGYVDYVLWADDGRPLAVVEAKRAKKSAAIGQQQAKLYADCLEAQFGQRPIIFYTNGYEHHLWDDAAGYPPRAVQGFFKKAELELVIQRRTSRKSLADTPINAKIVERYYQSRAIRRISETFERDRQRKALIVMATGAGKTRTVIALCDLLTKCNWVKRVLFLADRVALVNQAVNAFKTHLPDAGAVNLVTEKDTEGRVFVSTYPTMMGLIDESQDGLRRFGVGHFDLIVVDEAHRSVYQKYRAIFDYFDALLVGLTATPKDEIDFNTYGLFDLERGVPTDEYGLQEAVKDGFLVPPRAVSVPLKFPREGMVYAELTEEEKDLWDAIEWAEDGSVPSRVEAEAVNKWLFNRDTVDKALEHLMTRGQKVAGGDRLGKTIIFAKNQKHAEFIADRFNANYPHYAGQFARVVHCDLPYVQSLIDDFSAATKAPHIAISVDMLDTGIDIPEVVNLVFIKLVRSKTKFWQMLGRGTRLRPELFGPGKDKAFFFIFDYCQNLEFFSQDPATTDGAPGESLGKKLFKARVELIGELDQPPGEGRPAHHKGGKEPRAPTGAARGKRAPGRAAQEHRPPEKTRTARTAGPIEKMAHPDAADYEGHRSTRGDFGAQPSAAPSWQNQSAGDSTPPAAGSGLALTVQHDHVARIQSHSDGDDTAALRSDTAEILHTEVAAMNVDNFVVRPKRLLVEKYAKSEAWIKLDDDARAELAHEVAGLPSELPSEDEEAKRFDLLILSLQLALLRSEPAFVRLRDQVKSIAGLLEEKASIPMVKQQIEFILELQTDDWWQDVTPPMLENARRRLRLLVKLIDKQKRIPIYTDFEDEIGSETLVDLPGFAAPDRFERFRAKARAFLRQHEDHVAIRKLRMNKALTQSDLDELEQMLASSGVGEQQDLTRAREESQGLGLFVRSLIGLDREAAKQAFASFLTEKTFRANQIEFVNMIVNQLTDHGVMSASLLYESPFTDVAPTGPDELFTPPEVEEIIAVLEQVRASAVGL